MQRNAVAIVGAGLIGQAWAIVFARAGWRVTLWDGQAQVVPEALRTIGALVATLQEFGLVADAAAVGERISAAGTLADAVAGVRYVQENVAEDLAVKRAVFAQLDALVDPQVPIGSSTSGIPASAWSAQLPGRHRCLVAHPANPPYLLPVVELAGAPWTAAAVLAAVDGLMREVGQRPVLVRREIEGFILNRLQGAVLREAFRLVEQGYVDADGLDTTFRDGLGLRWSFMGPLETIDLNAPGGLRDYCARYGELYRRIAETQGGTDPWPAELIERLHAQRRSQVSGADLGAQRVWRDRRLMALAAHKKQMNAKEGE